MGFGFFGFNGDEGFRVLRGSIRVGLKLGMGCPGVCRGEEMRFDVGSRLGF